jgi:hypothetical protein
MTLKYMVIAAIALGSASIALSGAHAAKRAAGPTAAGCVHPVAPYCVGVTTRKGTFALLNANPFIPLGTGVTVWGTVTSNSPCGPSIQVARWQANPAAKCAR